MTGQENDAGRVLGYEYDKLNRRTEDTLPEPGRWNAYTYDKASNLTELEDQAQTVAYSYDDVDRVASIAAPNADDTATDTIGVAYDDTGTPRAKTLTLPGGATERYETDRSGKLTKVVSKTSGGAVLRSRAYSFTDGSAQRQLVQSVTDENQLTTSYTYEDATSGDTGRLVKALTRDSASRVVSQHDYVYDKAGNRTRRDVVTTLAGDPSLQPDTDTNEDGKAQAFRVTALASGTSASLTVYLDATNTAQTVKVGVYDDASGDPGALLGQATISTPSNGAWNRVNLTGATLTKGEPYWIAILQPQGSTGTLKYRSRFADGDGAQHSSQDTLTSLPGTWSPGTPFYDDGPIAAYITSTTNTTSYAFNNANQLCWTHNATSTNGCASPPTGATQFSYDAAGNQLTGDRTITYDHLTQTATISTPDPGNPLDLEFLGPDQTQLWQADGYIQQNNLLGLGFEDSDERLTRDPDTGTVVSITDNGDKRYLLHDGQDSTLALLTPNQQITRRYSYDPDGHTTNRGQGPDTIIQWNGATNLENQGIYHFGHRLYNPATARWTQPDPINQPTDLMSANLYAYADGDPVNRSDPSGLSPKGRGCKSRPQCYSYRPIDIPRRGPSIDCALAIGGTAVSVAGFAVPGPNALAAAGTAIGVASFARSC